MDKAKIQRVLGLYTKLMNGAVVNKAEEAIHYGVNQRSIQRDIKDINNFLEVDAANSGEWNVVIYDRAQKGYRLEQIYNIKLSNSEILALCKILLDSRAFPESNMKTILNKLITCCVSQVNQKLVRELIASEVLYYVEPKHKTYVVERMWELGQAIRDCQYIEIDYLRLKDRTIVTRKLKPVALLFSEYYFYLTAFIDDPELCENFDVIHDSFPTIYRLDRIQSLKVLKEKFRFPYNSRFQAGEFRKRIQFMYGGKLQKIKFRYSGSDVDAVLDRLPTAEIISEKDGIYILEAEVFGKGIDMWLRSQGDWVKKIEEETEESQ